MVLQLWEHGLLIEPAPAPKPLANHVDCCCPEGQCPQCVFSPEPIPTEWKADLGVGGWVDSGACDGCDQVVGEFTLDRLEPVTNCEWMYELEDICSKPACGCTGSSLEIWLRQRWVAEGQWRWWLDAVIFWASTTDIGCIRQLWQSAVSSDQNCYDLGGQGPGDKIQMDRVFPLPDAPWCGYTLCTSSLPDPVHIWVP